MTTRKSSFTLLVQNLRFLPIRQHFSNNVKNIQLLQKTIYPYSRRTYIIFIKFRRPKAKQYYPYKTKFYPELIILYNRA